jgi:hypothetical protein
MIHCSECDATLNQLDRSCWSCEAPLRRKGGTKAPKYFCMVVNLFYTLFTVLTVIALFSDIAPALKACSMGLLVLRLVKGSAEEMAKLGGLSAFKVVIAERNRGRSGSNKQQWQMALEKSRSTSNSYVIRPGVAS